MIHFWKVIFVLVLLLPPIASAMHLIVRTHRKIWLAQAWLVASILLLLLLFFSPENTLEFPFRILTEHPMGLATNSAGIVYVLLLAISGMTITIFTENTATKPFLWRCILNLWIFFLAAIVFFSADFLTRLSALELSVILVALYPLTQVKSPMSRRWMQVLEVYLPLRFAGALLLSIVFPLAAEYDNFQIVSLIELITTKQGPISHLLVLFLMALVVIKSASPPFDRWLTHSPLASDPNWGYAGLVITSSLAYYLIYRFLPILPKFSLLYLGIALLLALLANLKSHFSRQIIFDHSLFFTAQNFPTVLILLAAGEKSTLNTFLLLMIPLLSLMLLLSRWNNSRFQLLIAGVGFAVRILFPVLTVSTQNFPSEGIILYYTLLSLQALLFAQTFLIHRPSAEQREIIRVRTVNESRERSTFYELTRSIVDLEFHLDHLTRYANRFFRSISRTINRLHNDSLDRYLYWTVFFILMLFVLAFIG